MISVVQGNGHIGKPLRLSKFGSGKNNVLHGSAPKLLDPLLSQHPADCIGYIAFSRSIGAYNAGNSIMKFKDNFVGKGLKALNFNTF